MNLVCATGGQKLELSETAFARDFNEDLVHQVVVAYLAGGDKVAKPRRTDRRLGVAAESHGDRRVQGALVLGLLDHLYGEVVELLLLQGRKITRLR